MQNLGAFRPYQIVSLWDMLKAYAHLFCLIGDLLGTFGSAVEMIKNPDVPYAADKKESLLSSLEQTRLVCPMFIFRYRC